MAGALALGIADPAGVSVTFADQGDINPSATGLIVTYRHKAGLQKADGIIGGQTDTQGDTGVAEVTLTVFPTFNFDLKT